MGFLRLVEREIRGERIREKTGENLKINTLEDKVINNKKFWEELTAYFPLIPQGLHRKQRPIFYCHGNMFTESLPSNDMQGYTYRRTD
jgi:hypothetical protein